MDAAPEAVQLGRLDPEHLVLGDGQAGHIVVTPSPAATIESFTSGPTAVLLPAAVLIMLVLAAKDTATFLGHGPTHAGLLLAAGVLTAVPMLTFGAGPAHSAVASRAAAVRPARRAAPRETLSHGSNEEGSQ